MFRMLLLPRQMLAAPVPKRKNVLPGNNSGVDSSRKFSFWLPFDLDFYQGELKWKVFEMIFL